MSAPFAPPFLPILPQPSSPLASASFLSPTRHTTLRHPHNPKRFTEERGGAIIQKQTRRRPDYMTDRSYRIPAPGERERHRLLQPQHTQFIDESGLSYMRTYYVFFFCFAAARHRLVPMTRTPLTPFPTGAVSMK